MSREVAIRRLFEDVPIERCRELYPTFAQMMGKLSSLRSPGLIQFIDGGIDEVSIYQVVEMLDGSMLIDRLTEGEPFSLEEFEQFSKDLLSTMDEVHAHHLFHSTLSAQSIQMTKRTLGGQRYKIIDLGYSGLARTFTTEGKASAYGLVEPAFMAPEYFHGETPSQAMDQYNCGQLFYATLVGGHPFAGLENHEIIEKLEANQLPSVCAYREDIPEEIGQWIDKMSALHPADRYPSIKAALADRPNIPELKIKLMATNKIKYHAQRSITKPSAPPPTIQHLINQTKVAPSSVNFRLTMLITLAVVATLITLFFVFS